MNLTFRRSFRSTAALAVAAVGIGGFVVAPNGALPVHAAPAGFTDSLVANVSSPTAIEDLPGERIAVAEQFTGRIRLIDSETGAVLSGAALDLNVCGGSERGLLGFTTDPDIGVNGRVYVYYTRPASGAPGGCVNRVSAFRMVGDDIVDGSEQVLIDNISSINGNHNAGDLEVGNDGFLYVSTGDAGRDPRGDSGAGGANDAAADLSLLNGKILRIDRFTGAPAPGNPLSGAGTARCATRGNTPATPTTSCQEIFAWGLRNPFRFAFDPNTSATRFFINDVGQGTREEVNEGVIAADYGWPTREGQCRQGEQPPCDPAPDAFTDPVTDYGRSEGTFITAGAFIPDGMWPAEYDGGYLFADGGTGKMWLRQADGTVDYGAPFTTGVGGLADMAFVLEPEGYALYYTLVSGQVRKIVPEYTPAEPTGPQVFTPLPVLDRKLDTRELSPPAPIRGDSTRLVDLEAPDGATAALINIGMIRPTGGGYISAWKPRTQRPTTSTVNAPNATVVANSAIVPVDDEGNVLLHVRTTAHVIVDVAGFFSPAPAAVAAGRFVPLTPTRVIDSREAVSGENNFARTTLGDGRDRVRVPIADVADVPTSGVAAVVLSVTGLSGAGAGSGYLTVHPTGSSIPTASNVNVAGSGDIRANLVVVPLGDDGGVTGGVDVVLAGAENVVIDVTGYFTDATEAASTDGRFRLIAPNRTVDSRIGLGSAAVVPGQPVTVDPNGVPGDAAAVAQNLTIAFAASAANLRAYPADLTELPTVSNVNATAAGQVRAAMALTPLAGGAEKVAAVAPLPQDFLVDVVGYFE